MFKHLALAHSWRCSWQTISLVAFALSLLSQVSCNSADDDDDASGGAESTAATGGSVAFGGSSSTGGHNASATGGSFTSGSSIGAGGSAGAGGSPSAGGSPGAGGALDTAGRASAGGVPGAGPDGTSPYQRECRGETAMCVDVASLRCLGIRDGTTVAGYSCSNPCQTDADCSKAPSSAQAASACIDFVAQKHCLLLCQQAGKTFSCPTGMGCYVYPGAATGYCLWP